VAENFPENQGQLLREEVERHFGEVSRNLKQ